MSERKLHILLESIMFVLGVWLVNQLADSFNVRLDLTEEKKYTVSNATKELLRNLEEEVFFEVYLEGDFPGNFKRFQGAIAEMLDRFAAESDNVITYKFTDPSQANNTQARSQFYQSLINRGLEPTNLSYKNADGDRMEKLIFPGAMVSKRMREVSVNLLKGNSALGPEEQLNQAIEGLEYRLAAAIVQLEGISTKKIGYITGHGVLDSLSIAGFRSTVLSKYDLFNVSLKGKKELSGYDAVVVAKPDSAFSEQDKYLMDQYLMRGGNILFFMDALSLPDPDSMFGEGTVAIPRELNLTDMLFRYGVRINQNYILDINSGQLPVVTGNIGDQPQIQMIPWPFSPVLTHFSGHPSVRNLDAILGQFVSEVDTVKAAGIKKTPLITTSQYTKVIGSPVRVAFNDLRDELRPEKFTDGPRTIGYLLEGSFTSLYANRLIPKGFDKMSFVDKGTSGKVIVIGDGDMVRNEIDPESGEALGLGVEPFTGTTYANEDFLLNVLAYLVDDSGLIEARSREVRIRPLDRVKVRKEKTKWQFINLVIPVFLILLPGLAKWYRRRKKFAT
ncbi:MAG: gliding motility-associated ABC transporter substrate-binding protein GldG [Ekhidna sp.]|nr:gliding motility-associated ABC transporter substrate-binding protein GldG [Ekhidna sp.]MBC6410560.1 gliding motility-associated ABC transporter substrate-binding protein GldG [Ekhidna sp.]MBC6426675.1 gliding motility-associated ABC transporter substrate-binding protein GldG [Ekhidna sp.]